MFDLLPILNDYDGGDIYLSGHLQTFPDYTSPPLDVAIDATPEVVRDDAYLNQIRDKVDPDNGKCNYDTTGCQILFSPPPEAVESGTVKVGVVFYRGALVDPRSYSVIAKTLSDEYGLAIAIPIFPNNIALLGCNGTDSLSNARSAFPYVEKWVPCPE